MAGNNNIPERLINFRLYNEGKDLLGVATIDLPSIEPMTETISGAGVAGEVETGILGHYGSMTTTITWRTIEKAAMSLFSQKKAHAIEAYGSQQIMDAATGETKTQQVRLAMRLKLKSGGLGTFEPNATTDTEQEFEVLYIKLSLDGKKVMEIDKYNFKAEFNGVDELDEVRKDLGM